MPSKDGWLTLVFPQTDNVFWSIRAIWSVLSLSTQSSLFPALKNVWGLKSRYHYFYSNVKEGDRLWFVRRGTRCTLEAVAIYVSHNKRTKNTPSNANYGWTDHTPEFGGVWDMELKYKDIYDLRKIKGYNFCTNIISPNPSAVMPKIIQQTSQVNLKCAYDYILQNK